ncbi:hypothetical protein [Cellulomonas sp. URHD0024]|uniref:hypothetical protein n=1 Tax=Cellulomonas sp. URHD0024 TaxID=1302620 RepID=UPI0004033485|nr:hypothetical protein [Cellulomonas sp. URHD0024]
MGATGAGTIVFLHLVGPEKGSPAGTFDCGTGVLTPVRTSLMVKPVRLERRAYVHLRGRKTGVDLSVERFNGWRQARVPLLESVGSDYVSQPPEVVRPLIAEIEARRPIWADKLLPALVENANLVEKDRSLLSSLLARRVGAGGNWSL